MTDPALTDRPRVWGLKAIARALNRSTDTVRRWARNPDIPIHKPEGSGRYFAYQDELVAWLKGGR